jgi:hypothetical protein
MPTPTGLPKSGEVWELQIPLPPGSKDRPTTQAVRFVVLSRTRDDYWAMQTASRRRGQWRQQLRVDCAYHLSKRWLRYVGPVGESSMRELRMIGWLR